MNLLEWALRVEDQHPNAQFTIEDGTHKTYGPVGSITAHIGPDMQADVVGVFCEDVQEVY